VPHSEEAVYREAEEAVHRQVEEVVHREVGQHLLEPVGVAVGQEDGDLALGVSQVSGDDEGEAPEVQYMLAKVCVDEVEYPVV